MMKFDFTTAYDFENGRTEAGFDVNATANVSGYFTVRDANGDGLVDVHELVDFQFKARDFNVEFGIGEYTGDGYNQLGCEYYTLGCLGPKEMNYVATPGNFFVSAYHVGPTNYPTDPFTTRIKLTDTLDLLALSFIDPSTGYMIGFTGGNIYIFSVFDVDSQGFYKNIDYSDAGNIGFLTSIKDGYKVIGASPVPVPASGWFVVAGLAVLGAGVVRKRRRVIDRRGLAATL